MFKKSKTQPFRPFETKGVHRGGGQFFPKDMLRGEGVALELKAITLYESETEE